jgi:hypothetical protein
MRKHAVLRQGSLTGKKVGVIVATDLVVAEDPVALTHKAGLSRSCGPAAV